jgi:TIR domain
MADILCLDTEAATVAALRGGGHAVHTAPFGYHDGFRFLDQAPQDFDLIVCDLRQPACFDHSKWGPYSGNDNYKCNIIPAGELNWDTQLFIRHPGGPPKKELLHRLIYETQIERMNMPSPFGPTEIRQAISMAGVRALIFLKPEWVLRTGGHEFPSFVGMRWNTAETRANKYSVADPLLTLCAPWAVPLDIARPIRCELRSNGSDSLGVKPPDLRSTPIVVDRMGASLGQYVEFGKGAIWLLPATHDNATTSLQLANSILVGAPSAEAPESKKWDVFISHASEDKQFTDQLYAALTRHGVSVWYDKSVLVIGDSLRKKIDEGLAGSRFGVVVVSRPFFSKQWPQAELDALFSMQNSDGRKRILPVWHEIEREEVAKHSPLIAGLMASQSSSGLQQNVADILHAIGWPRTIHS